MPIPSLVRAMTGSKIIYLYHEECREHGVERTCFRLLEICSASKQKSLQVLDNTSTTGEEAFETIASIVENIPYSKMTANLCGYKLAQIPVIAASKNFF